MYPQQFEYVRPSSVDEAIGILASNPDAKVLAGGHSLIPAMKLRLAAPGTVVDIGKIDGLAGIDSRGGAKIGAMTTYAAIVDSDKLGDFPMLTEATKQVGDPSVRNRGTIGGSMAHNDPAADLTAVMLALNASVTAKGKGGEREVAVDDLFVGLLTTSLAEDEIITSVNIPNDFANAKQAYVKHAHPASGYAVVGVAVAVTEKDGKVESARIGVTGAPEHAKRATSAEAALTGKTLDAETIAAAAALAADDLGELNGDVYASPEYRAHLVRVLTKRALTQAAGL
ncbi:MAG: xanthine dehydrogenase family protein subunit M [Thermomicrobiales bacterium]|nr:xanthine dehydrogenase family protein subunit M [Thermomicrobiales bacterium]MCO5222532.1 xanthine dehydrogenase family protein subunit M [Thermomicrobiales bacterium]